MELIYAREPLPLCFAKSLFPAGPPPRSKNVKSWRPEAIRLLEERGYDGVVFVPESRDGKCPDDRGVFEEQVKWEHAALERSDCVLFWVPRDLKTLPGFTTNVEFGMWANSGKAVLGAPKNAEKISYLRMVADKFAVPHFYDLGETINMSLAIIGKGAFRQRGECEVP